MGTGTWRIVATVVALAACRQLVGIGEDPPGGPVQPAAEASTEAGGCGLTVADVSCQACMESQCCPQATKCAGVASCSQLETCQHGCNGDPTCRATCARDHGLGNDTATPGLEACLASSCADACGLSSCGGLAALFPPATATACESCIVANACEAVTACATDATCQARLRCEFSSETVDVVESCGTVGDAGSVGITADQSPPIASACGADCSWGSDWSCLGKVALPGATFGAIDVTVAVTDETAMPVAGATASLCAVIDTQCASPAGSGTTGTDGRATFVRKPIGTATAYYVQVSSPTLATTLVFWFFPLSEPAVTIPVPAFSLAALDYEAQAASWPLDSSQGQLVVGMDDCRLGAAPGVELSLAPRGGASPFSYFGPNLALSTTATVTGSDGIAIAFDVPPLPTLLELTATVASLQRSTGTMTIFARPGAVTEVFGTPTQ